MVTDRQVQVLFEELALGIFLGQFGFECSVTEVGLPAFKTGEWAENFGTLQEHGLARRKKRILRIRDRDMVGIWNDMGLDTLVAVEEKPLKLSRTREAPHPIEGPQTSRKPVNPHRSTGCLR